MGSRLRDSVRSSVYGSDVGFMMLNAEGRHCQSPAGCLKKMALGLYCRPKRELLSPKSFRAETFGESYLT